jgi:hypothetical protein
VSSEAVKLFSFFLSPSTLADTGNNQHFTVTGRVEAGGGVEI